MSVFEIDPGEYHYDALSRAIADEVMDVGGLSKDDVALIRAIGVGVYEVVVYERNDEGGWYPFPNSNVLARHTVYVQVPT